MKSDRASSPSLPWTEKLGILGIAVVFLFLGLWTPAVTEPLGTYVSFFVSVLVFLVGTVTLGQVLRPYGRKFRENVRAADDSRFAEYSERCANYRVPVRGVWVTDVLRGSDEFAEIAGLRPGDRHLFLNESFFDVYTPAERDAALAREAGRSRNYVLFLRAILVYLVLLAYFGLVLGAVYVTGDRTPFPHWPLVPEITLVPLFAAGTWIARRATYRANRFAAERSDVATVVGVLEKLEEAQESTDENPARTVLHSIFGRKPPYRVQIERLLDGSDK
jgi:hypothetical protein